MNPTEIPPVAMQAHRRLQLLRKRPPSSTIHIGLVAWLENYKSFGEGEIMRRVAFTPDGRLLATGGANDEVHLWRVVYRP